MKLGIFSVGFTMGLGTGLVLREALPILSEIVAPLAKVTIKMGMKVFERSREGLMRAGEVMEDLLAEVQEEMKEGNAAVQGARETNVRKKGRKAQRSTPVPAAVEITGGLREVA